MECDSVSVESVRDWGSDSLSHCLTLNLTLSVNLIQ